MDTPKYKLIPEEGTRLLRIVALRAIPRYEVKVGDKGGLVQSEANLAQDGDCWVTGEAHVFGQARVSGEARVSGQAHVSHPSHLLCVSGLRFHVTITPQNVAAGCRIFSHEEFRALTLTACKTPGWTDEELRRIVSVLDLFHPSK